MRWTMITMAAAILALGAGCPKEELDVQGHRGCRGLLPENTIEAFVHATEMGVTTLELDLGITRDGNIVVSHEPFFSSKISTDPHGRPITKEEELSHNIYKMTYDSVRRYDVGRRGHEDYPEQKKKAAQKPTLEAVVHTIEPLVERIKRRPVFYNIEIKRRPDMDGIYHPDGEAFVRLVLDEIKRLDIVDRTCIQSFDMESLQLAHRLMPKVQTAALIYQKTDIDSLVTSLEFAPTIISPYHKLVNLHFMKRARDLRLQVIPWTVNEKEDMAALCEFGVDGIITDYPDRLLAFCKEEGIKVK